VIERRFLVSAGALDAVSGDSVLVQGEEHHHLSRVLRLRAGDAVSLFDGAGRGFMGNIESIEKHQTRVRLTAPDDRTVEPRFRLVLLQGIPQHDRMDVVIQKTTEIGVAAIVPIIAARTVLRPGREGRWGRLDRWRRVASEAARQSGRLRVPEIAEPIAWGDFLGGIEEAPHLARLLLDPETPPGAAEERFALGAHHRSALLAVGPEGGWSHPEVVAGRERGFSRMGLGPRILRTETAGIVAVALILFLAGEMGRTGGEQIPII
jgi:16S rRNA (uracil1498-N3)-methyltransferase